MKVLAIDPGERVGWAVGLIDDGVHPDRVVAHELVVDKHGISSLKDFALAMWRAIVVEQTYDAVVYETFRIRPVKAKSFGGSDMPTIQLIGMIRLCCWVAQQQGHPVQCISQGPSAKTSARMSLVHEPDGVISGKVAAAEKLKHDEGHDGDALLHLWNFYFERYF